MNDYHIVQYDCCVDGVVRDAKVGLKTQKRAKKTNKIKTFRVRVKITDKNGKGRKQYNMIGHPFASLDVINLNVGRDAKRLPKGTK